MDLIKKNTLDMDLAKRKMDIYKSMTGVDCLLIDKFGNVLYSTASNRSHCEFCELFKGSISDFPGCKYVHLYGAYQSERFGGNYVFFCQLGLVHWASPIIINNTMEAAMLGGPVLMINHDEFYEEDILGKYQLDETYLKQLKLHLSDVQYIDSHRVNDLSEGLSVFAKSLSDETVKEFETAWNKQKQQDNISEEIHEMKKSEKFKDYPIEKEKELQKAIRLGDKEESSKLLNEIFGFIFFSSGNDFEIIKARSLELIILLSRSALEGGADVEQIFGMNHVYIKEIDKIDDIEDLTDWFSNIMARFTDLVFNLKDVKHADTMFKALSFIKKNYMKKISLEDTAGQVHLSPSYFSKIFKQEMKCNFNTYLNFYRIEVSKELLKTPDTELVDIAYIVGYEDQSYFSKVFKKVTGISPGKYRESVLEK